MDIESLPTMDEVLQLAKEISAQRDRFAEALKRAQAECATAQRIAQEAIDTLNKHVADCHRLELMTFHCKNCGHPEDEHDAIEPFCLGDHLGGEYWPPGGPCGCKAWEPEPQP